MTWSVTFVDAVQRDGRWAFSLVFTDGQQKVLREYQTGTLDDASVKTAARAEISTLDIAKASSGKLSIQPGATLDLTPDPAVVMSPTTAEAAREKWLTDYRLFQSMQRGLAAGITKQPDLDAQAAKVQAGYIPEYQVLL